MTSAKEKNCQKTIFNQFGKYENLFFPKQGFLEQVMVQNVLKYHFMLSGIHGPAGPKTDRAEMVRDFQNFDGSDPVQDFENFLVRSSP